MGLFSGSNAPDLARRIDHLERQVGELRAAVASLASGSPGVTPADAGAAEAAWGTPLPNYQPSERVYTAVLANRKIEAIKIVREETGWGLKEAKDFVDRFVTTL